MRLQVLLFGGPVGPPPPSRLFVVGLIRWMELGAIGTGGPVEGGRRAWLRTVTGRFGHVTFYESRRFGRGQILKKL